MKKKQKQITPETKTLSLLWVFGVMVILLLAVYYPVFTHQFTNYDDDVNIYNNTFYPLSLGSFAQIWRDVYIGFYIPVTYSLWGFQYWLAQTFSFNMSTVFHTVNLMFHLGCGFIVFFLLKDLLGLISIKSNSEKNQAALIGALFFLLHPIQAEVVSWGTGFKDMISGFFSILALFAYVRYLPEENKKYYALTLLAFLLAVLSKPSAVCVIGIFFLIDRGLFKRSWWISFRDLLAPVIVVLPPIILAQMAQDRIAYLEVDFGSRILMLLFSTGFYISKLFLPMGFIPTYGFDPHRVLDEQAYLLYGTIFLAFLGLISVFKKHRKALWGGFCIFLLGILPYSGLLTYDGQQQSTVSDRYIYFAIIGIAFMLSYLKSVLPKRLISIPVFLSIGILAMLTGIQCRYWENSASLFQHTLAVDPLNRQAHFNLATDADKRGEKEQAIFHFKKGLERVPGEPYATKRLSELFSSNVLSSGNELASRGDLEGASKVFEQVLISDPHNYSALVNLGNIAAMKHDIPSAITYFSRAIASEPKSSAAYLNIGRAYAIQGEMKLAHLAFKKVMELEPDNSKVQEQLRKIGMSE